MSGLDHFLDVEENESRKWQSGSLRRLIRQVLQHRALLLIGVSTLLVGTLLQLWIPWFFGKVIDEVLIPKKTPLIRWAVLIYFLTELLRLGLAVALGILFTLLGQRVMQELRMAVFTHLHKLPLSLFDRTPTGRLVTRVTNDVSAIAQMFSAGIITIFGNAALIVAIIIWLFILDFRLAIAALAIIPPMIVISVIFSRLLKVAYREARSKLSALNAFLAENILGIRIVQLFNRQKLHLDRFQKINHWYTESQTRSIRIYAFYQPTITLCAGIAMALTIWYGGLRTVEFSGNPSGLKLGVLVSFFTYVLSLFQPIREIADKWNVFLSGMASAERIFSLLDWKEEPDLPAVFHQPLPQKRIKGHLVFEKVWFAYEKDNWVLKDLTFEAQAGERVGIVGHTGAGKSTIIHLLMRFYEINRGRILLDGRDLREYDKRELRSLIGLIQQDVFLFSGSLQDNLTFWDETIPSHPSWKLLSSHALDRKLEERGLNLSVGERQLASFVRVATRNPALWILDEATANIDSESERLVEESLLETSKGCTTLLIAHRLASVRKMDLILVLHKGALVEQGSHEALIRQGGLYARLCRFQEISN